MADTKFNSSNSADVITTDPKPANTAEPTYEISDHIKAAQKLYGHNGAFVKTALRMAGKDRYSVAEAKQVIEKFANTPIDD